MKSAKLTAVHRAATSIAETGKGCRVMVFRGKWAAAVLAPFALGGCINVNAPTEPIVIELNINIRQEVIYQLAEDAGTTIEENADIF
ncbi:MAG: YnbE family lipoprotein [Sphingomonadaceae bacterium]|nr:YnbE family lipoprotein [Sphingomonadaceae bacterium]MCP5383736.1 YnbE family lipoprotein [Altererythrobacter sp.]MCP5391342.1 YnbE family lipoprotein [Sphingomonadaceae bacterium]